jgi:hypothetical protein
MRSMTVSDATISHPTSSLSALAASVIAQLDAIESSLDLDIVVRPNDVSQNRALTRVSDAAIGLASDLVSSAPARFADFTQIASGASYIAAMEPLVERAMALALHLRKSVWNHRTPAAQQTLALYSVVKGLGRIVDNESMREKAIALKAEIAPKRRNAKPKVTAGEKAAKRVAAANEKKVAKAMKVLADAGITQVEAPSPSPSSTETAR